MPSIDVMQIDEKYYLYMEGELLGVFDDLRGVADEMLRTVVPKVEEEQNERNDFERNS